MIESALRTFILANDDVSDIVGTKIYPVYVAQSVSQPYIVYRRVSTERFDEHGSPGGIASVTVTFDCYAATYEVVKDLAEAVRQTCDGVSGSLDIYEVRSIFVEDESDIVPQFDTGAENPLFGVQMTIVVHFREES